MSEADAEDAIEVQEEAADDDEPAVEVDEAPVDGETASAETRTVQPFYATRGEPDGTTRVRAGWRYEDGSIHSLPVDNTVSTDLAQMAEDLARSWHQLQLNRIAQQQAAAAEEAPEPDDA